MRKLTLLSSLAVAVLVLGLSMNRPAAAEQSTVEPETVSSDISQATPSSLTPNLEDDDSDLDSKRGRIGGAGHSARPSVRPARHAARPHSHVARPHGRIARPHTHIASHHHGHPGIHRPHHPHHPHVRPPAGLVSWVQPGVEIEEPEIVEPEVEVVEPEVEIEETECTECRPRPRPVCQVCPTTTRPVSQVCPTEETEEEED